MMQLIILTLLTFQKQMYPPKRDANTQRNKYGSPTFNNQVQASPNNGTRDLNKINKILENAKNYYKDKEKQKQAKKDYMMEGLNNMNSRKTTKISGQGKPQNKERIKSKESEQQAEDSLGKINRKNIYVQNRQSKEEEKLIRENRSGSKSKVQKTSERKNSMKSKDPKTENKIKEKSPINIQVAKGSNKYFDELEGQKKGNDVQQTWRESNKQQTSQKHQQPYHTKLESNISEKSNAVENIYQARQIPQKAQKNLRAQENQRDSNLYNRSSIDESKLIARQNQNTLTSMKILLEQNQHQLSDIRRKYYKAEEDKNYLENKIKLIQNQEKETRQQNQQIMKKMANLESKLQQKQKQIENLNMHIDNLENRKHDNIKDLEQKLHYNNDEMLDKVNQIRYLTNKINTIEHKLKNKELQSQKMAQFSKTNENIIQKIKNQYEGHIHQLEEQISALKMQLRAQKEQNQRNLKTPLEFRKQIEKELKQRMEQDQEKFQGQFESLQSQIRERDVMINHLKNKSNVIDAEDFRLQTLEEELIKTQTEKVDTVDRYEKVLAVRDQIIQELREELKISEEKRLRKQFVGFQPEQQQFQQILQEHVDKINELRGTISEKNIENINIRAQIEKLSAEKNNLKSHINLLEAQLQHSKKIKLQQYETAQKITENQIKTLRKKLQTLYKQLELKKKQINEKDKFIQSYLLSVTREEQVAKMMNELDRIFPKNGQFVK